MPKITITDFWAPWCLDPETPILSEDGYIKASQVKLGTKLLTIDPITKEQALKEVRKKRIFKNVSSRKMILETGKELIGDENHLVLTDGGFKKLAELTTMDRVLINPVKNSLVPKLDNKMVIVETTGNIFADKFLQKINLLPLKADDPKLLILARVLGFVMTDGYLYIDLKHNVYESHFFVGTEEDALTIKKDLESLGFKNLEIKREIKERVIGERKFTISVLRCRNFNRALLLLLKSLGSPVGRKKNQPYFVPDWIMEGETPVKREFMSGWLGGDGCKIDYRIKHGGVSAHDAKFGVNSIEFHKEKELEQEGILYAKQLSQLLEELGVLTKEISSKDDEDGVIISLRLATDYNSLFHLTEIEYAYAKTKNLNVSFIREFLQYRLYERQNYAQVKQEVQRQLAFGNSNQFISQNHNIPMRTVVSWRYNKDVQVTHPSLDGQARFDRWLEERQQNDLLWEKVKVIETVENRDVIGITVDNPHTLVTNGIVSHNCGPCRIMDPILDELEKEFKDVEFKKVNADEEPEKTSSYGVMGLPTFVIEKDGKEIGRKIGVTSKAELAKLLSA